MSKMKKKRAVSLLLCLGIVATMSVGSLTVSADTFDAPDCETIVVSDASDYVTLSDGKLNIAKDGQYSFFKGFMSTDDGSYSWTSLSKTGDTDIESWAVAADTMDYYVAYSEGDAVDLGEALDEFGGILYFAYKANASDTPVIYEVDCWSTPVSPDYPDGMFFVDTVTERSDVCEVRVTAHPLDGRSISSLEIFYTNEDGEYEWYDFGDVDYSTIASDGLVVPLYVNGRYKFSMTDSEGVSCSTDNYEVTCIDSAVVPEPDVSGAPKIEYSLSTSDTGLSASDALSVIVTTDRNCTITGEDMPVFTDTSSAEFIIPRNGVYSFYAIDPDTEESSEVTVTITSFGDGSIDPDYADEEHNNDNPLNDENKNNYWQSLENNGGLSADGNLIDLVSLTVNDDGSVTAKGGKSNPSDKLGVLPQTGITSWVVAIGCSLFAIIAGTFLMFRKGIFKKLSRKGGK